MSSVRVVIDDEGVRPIFDFLDGWREKVCFNCSTHYVLSGGGLVLFLNERCSGLGGDRKPNESLLFAERVA
jgi:hypothetical protein